MASERTSGTAVKPNLIDRRILALRRTRPRLMFSTLTEALPDCTWHQLLQSLGRLRKQRQVELLAHRWDCEVIFLGGASPQLSLVRSPDRGDAGGHDERTHA